jgi:uncharacterized protein YecE (DUF72 family)
MRIGTAGWTISRETADAFPGEGRHLERYARVLGCAEINSSFHRSHRRAVYERWAASTPPDFRFAAKLPRAVTHDRRLRRVREPLRAFLDEAGGLGERLAVVLVQLPPSFAFESRPVRAFFALLAEMYTGAVVCEPRHPTWFTPAADRALVAARVGRAAADPPCVPEAMRPGGWLGADGDGGGAVLYHRWHGSPRMYWSRYVPDWIAARADDLRRWPAAADPWCLFDNTASGAAIANAIELRDALHRERVDA